jgi:cytochrome b561
MKGTYAWTKTTRALHGFLAISVVIQVGFILFRENVDKHGSWTSYRQLAITGHKYLGMLILLIVVAYFVSKVMFYGRASFLQFYPVTRSARLKVIEDLKCLFLMKKIPVRARRDNLGGLSGLIQGLGLLLVFGLALVGTLAMFSWEGWFGVPDSWGTDLIKIHKFFAGLIWWYLGGHFGMAFFHRILPARFQKEMESH